MQQLREREEAKDVSPWGPMTAVRMTTLNEAEPAAER
jgi:hypothetical protein